LDFVDAINQKLISNHVKECEVEIPDMYERCSCKKK